jgi:hypothetical protein
MVSLCELSFGFCPLGLSTTVVAFIHLEVPRIIVAHIREAPNFRFIGFSLLRQVTPAFPLRDIRMRRFLFITHWRSPLVEEASNMR